MHLKHKFVTTLLVVSCICAFLCQEAAATYCSLDRMKKFAMEACEHIFDFEALQMRPRRAINNGHAKNRNDEKSSKTLHYLKRRIYPSGGYLKVGHKHFDKLIKAQVSPLYKCKKLSQVLQEDKKMRYKREDKDYHNYSDNISYCCFNKCEEDFFC